MLHHVASGMIYSLNAPQEPSLRLANNLSVAQSEGGKTV